VVQLTLVKTGPTITGAPGLARCEEAFRMATAPAGPPEALEVQLGPRIREARERAKLTIVELAQRSGYSPGYISQVERDLANPSLGTLKRVANALGVPLPSFFSGAIDAIEPGSVSRDERGGSARVVRAGRRKALVYPGSHIQHQLLSPDLRGALEALWVSAPRGTGSGDEPYLHEGEEIGIVVRGAAECRVGDDVFALRAGDAITFSSAIPHSWRNVGEDTLEMVWVSTPPTF
jgi:transcriptional regulator with XRE-family HTH domain